MSKATEQDVINHLLMAVESGLSQDDPEELELEYEDGSKEIFSIAADTAEDEFLINKIIQDFEDKQRGK